MFIMKIKVFHYMYIYHVFATDTKRWKSGEAVWWHCHSAICWNPDGVEEAGREPYPWGRVLPTEQLQRQSQAIRTSVWRFRYDFTHLVSHDWFFFPQLSARVIVLWYQNVIHLGFCSNKICWILLLLNTSCDFIFVMLKR